MKVPNQADELETLLPKGDIPKNLKEELEGYLNEHEQDNLTGNDKNPLNGNIQGEKDKPPNWKPLDFEKDTSNDMKGVGINELLKDFSEKDFFCGRKPFRNEEELLEEIPIIIAEEISTETISGKPTKDEPPKRISLDNILNYYCMKENIKNSHEDIIGILTPFGLIVPVIYLNHPRNLEIITSSKNNIYGIPLNANSEILESLLKNEGNSISEYQKNNPLQIEDKKVYLELPLNLKYAVFNKCLLDGEGVMRTCLNNATLIDTELDLRNNKNQYLSGIDYEAIQILNGIKMKGGEIIGKDGALFITNGSLENVCIQKEDNSNKKFKVVIINPTQADIKSNMPIYNLGRKEYLYEKDIKEGVYIIT